VKFLVDAQLPPALARALCEIGYDAKAVRDLSLREADDELIWEYALALKAAIITKDQDFPGKVLSRETAPVVIWLRIGNTSNRALLAWLLPLWPEIIERIETGDKLIEVRS